MIEIDLTPIDELENNFWFIPDLICLILGVLVCHFGATYYIGEKKNEIEELLVELNSKKISYENLQEDVQKFKDLEKIKNELEIKKDSLLQITISKTARYQTVILLEHLSLLKPDGLWYENIKIDDKSNKIEIIGRSFDPILIADFMSSLLDTKKQKAEQGDLRTQIYFQNVVIESMTQTPDTKEDDQLVDIEKFPKYKLITQFSTREVDVAGLELN